MAVKSRKKQKEIFFPVSVSAKLKCVEGIYFNAFETQDMYVNGIKGSGLVVSCEWGKFTFFVNGSEQTIDLTLDEIISMLEMNEINSKEFVRKNLEKCFPAPYSRRHKKAIIRGFIKTESKNLKLHNNVFLDPIERCLIIAKGNE